MRITIEPTEPDNRDLPFPHYKVSVEVPSDDQTVDDMIELFRNALIATGYDAAVINERLSFQ